MTARLRLLRAATASLATALGVLLVLVGLGTVGTWTPSRTGTRRAPPAPPTVDPDSQNGCLTSQVTDWGGERWIVRVWSLSLPQ